MSPLHQRAVCVGVLMGCAVAMAYIGDAPRVVKGLTWACFGIAGVMLCLALGAP